MSGSDKEVLAKAARETHRAIYEAFAPMYQKLDEANTKVGYALATCHSLLRWLRDERLEEGYPSIRNRLEVTIQVLEGKL